MIKILNYKKIKVFEPIYNNWFFKNMCEKSKLKKEIDEKFGFDGGIIMSLINHKIDLKQYIMKCEIIGYSDYNVQLLQKIISFYESVITDYESVITGESYNSFKENISYLKTCTKILNKHMIDNF